MALQVRGQDGAAVSVVCPISMIFACAGTASPARANTASAAVRKGLTGELNTVRRRTGRSPRGERYLSVLPASACCRIVSAGRGLASEPTSAESHESAEVELFH